MHECRSCRGVAHERGEVVKKTRDCRERSDGHREKERRWPPSRTPSHKAAALTVSSRVKSDSRRPG